MSGTAGTWKCRLGVHVWRNPFPLRRGQSTSCLRCGVRKVGSGW